VQREWESRPRAARAVLDAQEEPVVDPAEIEIRVAPRVQLGATAQRLPAADRAGVLDDATRDLVGVRITSARQAGDESTEAKIP
jgi:hypothetical protein